MAKKKIGFPRTIYKSADIEDDTATKWGSWAPGRKGGAYHSLIVYDEVELKAGLELGYVDSFEEALMGTPETKKAQRKAPTETTIDEDF